MLEPPSWNAEQDMGPSLSSFPLIFFVLRLFLDADVLEMCNKHLLVNGTIVLLDH